MPYIFIEDHKLHYADSHPQGAPPGGLTFICIHGLGSSQNYYFPVIPWLTDKHRCITFDTYGTGRSSYTGLEQSVESIAEDVIAMLDRMKISKAVVVGHSMGAIVAIRLAVVHPDRVLAVVAIGPVHPHPGIAEVFQKRIKTVNESGMESMADLIPGQATGSRATALQKAFIRELILNQAPLGYASLCKVIVNAHPPDYASVKAPFLLIAGQEDKSAPMEGCNYIFEHISSKIKKMEVLPGVGHWHCIEASDEVGKLIAEFARTLQAGDLGSGVGSS